LKGTGFSTYNLDKKEIEGFSLLRIFTITWRIWTMANKAMNRLQTRMVKEINRCTSTLNTGNLIYVSLKREQVSQRYLRLMQAAMRRG
jgi:hypothetical protein